MTTVHVVKTPAYEYNDEGYYPGDTEETAAICATAEAAKRWRDTNGWNAISYAMEEPGEYGYDFPERFGAERVDWRYEWSEQAKKRAVAGLCRIVEVEVIT